MKCPVCAAELDEAKHMIAEKLSEYGYFHRDVWLKCERCGYTPVFGKELEKTKPVYFYPPQVNKKKQAKVIKALNKLIEPPISVCICGDRMILHKVWINTFRHDPFYNAPLPLTDKELDLSDPQARERYFLTKAPNGYYFKVIESGILAQLKCKDRSCKYVRYLTL